MYFSNKFSFSNSKKYLEQEFLGELLEGEATTFLLFLEFDEEGFGFFGAEESVATGDEGWASCLVGVATSPEVTTDEDPIVFDGEEIGDLGECE